MKTRLDTPEGRAQYAARFGAVEPVFGNVRYNKGLDRFTVRGRTKVDAQWKLFCLVHNIELNIVRVAILETKADTPLIVHGDRLLANPITFERMQPIAGGHQ